MQMEIFQEGCNFSKFGKVSKTTDDKFNIQTNCAWSIFCKERWENTFYIF